MGSKGAKSKSTRRNNALKRKILDPIFAKKLEKLNHINQMQQRGYDLLKSEPKNAYKYPNDPDAILPQKVPQPIIDLRSASNIEAIVEMKMEKARKKQLASGTRIKTAEQMEQDAMNVQPVDEAKEEANLIMAMSKMLLKDELKQKPKRQTPVSDMAEEKSSGVKKPIIKTKGKLKSKRDKVFR